MRNHLSFIWTWAVAGALMITACSDNGAADLDASFIYLDGGDDAAAPTDGPTADALPATCAVALTVVTASQGCRADWACPGKGLYTFACNAADGGLPQCYCITPDGTASSGAADGCSGDEAGVHTTAATFCGWPFAAASPTDGGIQ